MARPSGPDTARASRHGLGRIFTRVFMGLYLCALVYALGVGLISITRQVFLPAQGIAQVDAEACVPSLRRMADELETLARAVRPREGLEAWDAEVRTLHEACGPSSPHRAAYSALTRARYAIIHSPRNDEFEARLHQARAAIGDAR